jgi:hypothetical protein
MSFFIIRTKMSHPPTLVRIKRHVKGGLVQGCQVYIGRECRRGGWQLDESVWHNPFKLPPNATDEQRDKVLEQYEQYVRSKPELMSKLGTLCDQQLGCWCAPKPCHGDILIKLVKEWLQQQQKSK